MIRYTKHGNRIFTDNEQECLDCDGAGIVKNHVCKGCNGHGVVFVEIPNSHTSPVIIHTYAPTVEQLRAMQVLGGIA